MPKENKGVFHQKPQAIRMFATGCCLSEIIIISFFKPKYDMKLFVDFPVLFVMQTQIFLKIKQNNFRFATHKKHGDQ